MTAKIRLARGGAKKRPFYRIVVADSRAPRDGGYLERLGSYNPILPSDHPERLVLDAEKAKAWLDKGATPTDRVAVFLTQAGLIAAPKRSNPKKGLPKAKAQERTKMAEEAARVAAEKAAAGEAAG